MYDSFIHLLQLWYDRDKGFSLDTVANIKSGIAECACSMNLFQTPSSSHQIYTWPWLVTAVVFHWAAPLGSVRIKHWSTADLILNPKTVHIAHRMGEWGINTLSWKKHFGGWNRFCLSRGLLRCNCQFWRDTVDFWVSFPVCKIEMSWVVKWVPSNLAPV